MALQPSLAPEPTPDPRLRRAGLIPMGEELVGNAAPLGRCAAGRLRHAGVVEEDVAGRTFEEIGVGVEHAGTMDRALPQVFLKLLHGGMMALAAKRCRCHQGRYAVSRSARLRRAVPVPTGRNPHDRRPPAHPRPSWKRRRRLLALEQRQSALVSRLLARCPSRPGRHRDWTVRQIPSLRAIRVKVNSPGRLHFDSNWPGVGVHMPSPKRW